MLDLAIGHSKRVGVNRRRAGILPLLVAVSTLFLVTLLANPAQAGYAAIVIDADSGRILHSRNANTPNFPASLTKMMTLFMTFEALERGTLSLNQHLHVSKRAAGQPASKLGLKEGETITVDDAIRAMSVISANDVATVIAEALGGTEVKFAQMMTERARALGMTRTSFRNASGLPNRRQKTTARDMSILARALIDGLPDYYGYFSVPSFQYKGKNYRSHNSLLKDYAGTDGIKTGYIRASGFNLVTSAERDGVRLIGVVFGGKTAKRRDRQMRRLLNRSWAQARAASTFAARPIPKPEIPGTEADATAYINAPIPPTVLRRTAAEWGIQIGAFEGYTDAHIAAGNVAQHLSNLPVTASLKIQPVSRTPGTLFRARLMGMDEISARASCRQLVRNGQDCVLVTPQGDELASLPTR
ncbi:MAG: D-alanyl-D-alanine carboxypeptidase [Alphaproteobacteria bacterium]|nr:D-alanyl-D-alanine carboxypeptidase [Alphaproteobacteria bacterium]